MKFYFRLIHILLFVGLIVSESTESYAQPPTVQWVYKYGNTNANSADLGSMLTVDDSGNVYVTGIYYAFPAQGGHNFGTLKYNTNGTLLWDTTYNSPAGASTDDQAFFIAIDDSQNVYVCGKSEQQAASARYDYCTIKYDRNGNPVWINRFDRTGVDEDVPGRLKFNRGNVYVTGHTYDTLSSFDFTTIKYDRGGAAKWVKHYNGSINQDDYAYALDIDDSQNVFVAGTEFFGSTGNYYMTTIKYDSTGALKWIGKYKGPINDYAQAVDMVADDSGNVYVAGFYDNTSFSQATVLIKYNPVGDSVWVIRDDSLMNVSPVRIDIDNSGYILLTGRGDSGYVTIKYDYTGRLKWKAFFNKPGATPYDMKLDKNKNIYVTGTAAGSFPYPDMDYWTVKYDSSGAEKWRINYFGPAQNSDAAYSIALDTIGNVYVTGRSMETGQYDSQYGTVKYSQNVGISELSPGSGISYYPNPFTDKLTVTAKNDFRSASFILYNALGEQVTEQSNFQGRQFSISRGSLSPGIYFIRITDADKSWSGKVIIE